MIQFILCLTNKLAFLWDPRFPLSAIIHHQWPNLHLARSFGDWHYCLTTFQTIFHPYWSSSQEEGTSSHVTWTILLSSREAPDAQVNPQLSPFLSDVSLNSPWPWRRGRGASWRARGRRRRRWGSSRRCPGPPRPLQGQEREKRRELETENSTYCM